MERGLPSFSESAQGQTRQCINHKACLCQPFPTPHALRGMCRPSKLSSGALKADWQQVLSLAGIFKLDGGPVQT